MLLLASPVQALGRLLALAGTAAFWQAVAFSSLRILGGFLLACALAAVLAPLAARFQWIRDLLSPLVAVVKAVPVVSFIILALIFFSSENLSLLISALMVFPPVYLNVLEGIGHTDRQLLEMARVFRVPVSRQLRGIYLPAVLPYFRSAVSLGLGLCWKSGAAAEVIGLPAGSIGEALYTAKVYFQTGDLFAWTAVIVTVSVIFERLFLRLVDAGGEITTTNAVNVADYEELFRRLMEEYDAVIHLNIGMGFSSCHQNARLAAEEVDGVYVVDSANLTVGHGMLVLAAAEAAEAGKSVTEILAMLEEMIPRVETSFVLDRLDYMKKGGRCSTATALGASLLKLHPCLDVVDGKLPVTKKYRGSIEKVVEEYVRDRLRDRADLDTHRAFLVDTCPDDHLASIAREVLRQDGRFQEIIEAKAGCTIFCHCGPGTLGVIFLRKA